MKETTTTLLACDLLVAATALVGIIDQPVNKDGIISVHYQYASELIRDVQLRIKEAASELLQFAEERREAER